MIIVQDTFICKPGNASKLAKLFKEVMTRLSRESADSHAKANDGHAPEIVTYIIELHFRQVANEFDRRFFNSVRTSLQLPAKTVDRLRGLAARELAENREYRRLIRDLGGEPGQSNSIDRPLLTSATVLARPPLTFRSRSIRLNCSKRTRSSKD